MNGTYSIGKRLLAIILCIAMVASYLPAMALPASAADSENKEVDPSTINRWKDLFGPDVLSTEFAGGVWTDKSVFESFDDYLTAVGVSQLQGPTSAITDQVRDMLNTAPENFLVALSAIAANQQITGYTTTPTDTMLVLDVSQSMDTQGYIPDMITAANNTIKTLMSGNQHNRVGVVLFCGNQYQGENQTADTTIVLLPLDHYTSSNSQGTFLKYTGSDNNTTVYVADNVKDGDNNTVNNRTGKTTIGATYTQNGLYKAWGEFSKLTAADTVIPAGQPQEGTKRIPAVVLMSDGQPTIGDTTYYDIGNSTIGNGGTPNETTGNRLTFLTQLTAAWVKAKIANKYSIKNEEVRFYTLGLNTQNNRYATDTLNPAASTNEDVADYWTEFVAKTPNNSGQVTLGRNGYFGGWTTYKSADGMITSAAQRVYPTQYFSATNTAKLAEAFAAIADELTTGTPYVTLVPEGGEANLDGYVTFEDQLGAMMEVKDIKGLVMGNRVFTGAELARSMNEGDLGQSANPKDYGNEFVRTVKERLGIEDTTVAQNLIRNAYHSGQLSYTSATEYSNYIGWYADAEGNYVGFWQESDGYGSEGAPEGAVYINKSYGYLGAESSEEGASDMMHVVVMVRTEIVTGDQSIIYKIPASLIPTVMYNVELDGTDTSKPASITREEAFPLQLLAEVGLRSDINAVNLEKKVAEYVDNGGHAHKNDDGTYDFYTNRWGYGHGEEVDYDEPLTHVVAQSHFHPATDNSRYYVTEETLLCVDQNGTPYTGTAVPTGTGYYHARSYYEVIRGNAVVTTKYLPVSAVTLARVQRQGDNWYIPAGVPFQETERFRVEKAPNATETLSYADYPTVLHNEAGYNIYAFLGNNGKLTVAPAQGIALTKTVAELSEDADAPTEFTFTVTLSQAVASPLVTDTDGNPIDAEKWSVSRNVITVKLSADETVVITDIPAGTTYTVEEEATAYYAAASANASGTVAAYTVNSVDFVNTAKGYGSLVVGKDVNYPQGFVPGTAHNSKEFTIVVEFTGDITGIVAPAGAVRSGNAFTLKLKDGESVTFTNILEGTVYTVSEGTMPAGYAFQELRYTDDTRTIAAHDLDEAEVVNSYTLQPVSPNVKVRGDKTLVTNESSWGGETFTVELFRIDDFADQDPVSTGLTATISEADKDYEIDLSSISFTAAGTYYFRAVEVIPENRNTNIAYDRTYGLFSITVGDANADGALEIQNVSAYQTTTVSGNATSGWTVEKDFTNVVTTDRIYLDIQKNVVDVADNTPVNAHRGDITFGLFANMNAGTAPSFYMLTDTAGKATIMVPVTQQIITAAGGKLVYYLREVAPSAENRVVGMHYDESWLYAIEITWDAQNNTAVVRYAPMENGAVGTYQTYVEGTTVFNHTNTYEKDVKVELGLSGEKTLNGSTDLGGRKFSFSLYKSTAAFVQGELIETVENNGNTIAFSKVTFTAPGVYYMVARENASTLGGITIDGAVYRITVAVEKFVDTDGTTRLRVATGYPNVVKYGTSVNVGADGLDFNNIYTIIGSENVTISGHKTLTGRELIAGEFEFGLYEGEKLVSSVKNLTNGNFSFPTITYTPDHIGTHTYTVKEIVPAEKLGGVTYDNAQFTVVVKVEDNGEGGITVTKTVNNDVNGIIAFENTYDTQPIDVTLTGSKTLYNQDTGSYITLNGGEFTFFLHESNQDFTTQGELAVPAVTNGAGGAISILLKDLEAGDYHYILREDLGSANGMHYDTSVFNIRVLVTDNGDGTLRSMVTIRKSGNGTSVIAFGNTYTPEPTEHTISGTKDLTGRDIVDGEFTFELYEGGVLIQTAENVGSNFTFEPIEYTKSGTYTYTVKERIPEQAQNGVYKGVTYDPTVYTVTVTVSDNGGILQAASSHTAAQLVFSNKYEGADTHFSVEGWKVLDDKQLEAGMFSFEMRDKNNVHIATVQNNANGSFTFRNIPLADVGDYTYTIREVIPAGAELVDGKWIYKGITYSSDIYTVKVSVTDPGDGQLVAGTPVITKNEETAPVQRADFTNDYNVAPIEVTIRGIKELTGRNLVQGEFAFVLTGHGFNLQTTNKADGAIAFAPISLDKAGTYTFTITEHQGNKGGIRYDGNSYQVTIEVSDNGDGTLSADVIYPNGVLKFTNVYTVTGDTEFTVEGEKVLEGRPLNAQDVFEFELQDSAGAVLQTVKAVDGKFSITQKIDKLGLHTFTLTEKAPEGGVKDGVTYSKQVYSITVNVTDNGVGGMTAGAPIITIGGVDVAKATFTNTYKVTEGTKTDIEGKKTLSGNKTLEADMFTFELYAGNDITAEPIATAKNDAQGKILFRDVPLNTLGINTFTVMELAPEGGKLDGITYSTLVYTVTVETVDNGVGGMTALEPVYWLGVTQKNEMEFINTYAVEGEVPVTIQGMKTLKGGKKLTEKMFAFALYEGNQAVGEPIALTQNAADGSFTFVRTFKAPGEYTFTVKEVVPSSEQNDGITYSDLVYTVTVEIEDDGKGGMTAKEPVYRLGTEQAKMEFVNVYKPAEITVDLGIEKTVQSATEKTIGPEGFQFLLTDENGKEVETVESDKQGKAKFSLTFQAEDIGKTFKGTVSEVDTKKIGVVYSQNKYAVEITITQADSGELVPVIKVDGKQTDNVSMEFVNVYKTVETPNTGDNIPITLFISLMVISSFGLAAVMICKKREEAKETAE